MARHLEELVFPTSQCFHPSVEQGHADSHMQWLLLCLYTRPTEVEGCTWVSPNTIRNACRSRSLSGWDDVLCACRMSLHACNVFFHVDCVSLAAYNVLAMQAIECATCATVATITTHLNHWRVHPAPVAACALDEQRSSRPIGIRRYPASPEHDMPHT